MANTNHDSTLALYQFRACPFCARTGQVIDGLSIKIENRDIQINPKYRAELIQNGGSPQVPCLRIESNKGQVQWLYESAAIIKYLKAANTAALNA
jgi:glutaredoxin